MTPDNEHSMFAWIAGPVLTVSIFIASIFFNRQHKRQDDIESRVRELEHNAVTRSELRRLEEKIDQQGRNITDRLDTLYKLMSEK